MRGGRRNPGSAVATKSMESTWACSAGMSIRAGSRPTAAASASVYRIAGSVRAWASRSEITPNWGAGWDPSVGTSTRVSENQFPAAQRSWRRLVGTARRSSPHGVPRCWW